jgi:hypothetical protein
VPVQGVILVSLMVGDDEEDTRLLTSMASQARDYLNGFPWCKSVTDFYFGDGCGGIIALFLARIEPARPGVDEWLWVVWGVDFPPAYLVIDTCKTPLQAFERYLDGITTWIRQAKIGKSSKDGMPIYVPPTPENAKELEKKLVFLRDVMLPALWKDRLDQSQTNPE